MSCRMLFINGQTSRPEQTFRTTTKCSSPPNWKFLTEMYWWCCRPNVTSISATKQLTMRKSNPDERDNYGNSDNQWTPDGQAGYTGIGLTRKWIGINGWGRVREIVNVAFMLAKVYIESSNKWVGIMVMIIYTSDLIFHCLTEQRDKGSMNQMYNNT